MKSAKLCYTIGLLLIAAALALTVFNLREDRQAGAAVQTVLTKFPEDSRPEALPSSEPSAEPAYQAAPLKPMPVREIDGREYVGKLEIPALSLTLPVLSSWSDENLKVAPCLYSGSIYQNNLILCGHNYTAHFGHLSQLQLGDAVIFTDMDGNAFPCTVEEILLLPEADAEEITTPQAALTLFTCDRSRANRITVRCTPAA